MKTKNILTFLAIVMLIALTACNSKQTSPDTGTITTGTQASTGAEPTTTLKSSATGQAVSETIKEINIEAYNFGFNQDKVAINKGDKVRLRITSKSGTHGVKIPGLGLSTGKISPGEEKILEFTADNPGSYDYYCNVPCGEGHKSMKGNLGVQ